MTREEAIMELTKKMNKSHPCDKITEALKMALDDMEEVEHLREEIRFASEQYVKVVDIFAEMLKGCTDTPYKLIKSIMEHGVFVLDAKVNYAEQVAENINAALKQNEEEKATAEEADTLIGMADFDVTLYFRIIGSKIFEDRGEGYAKVKFGHIANINGVDKYFIQKAISDMANACDVPLENVELILWSEFSEEMENDEDE